MDKLPLVEQMVEQLRTAERIARHASADAEKEARTGATADEKRHDARVQIEYSQMARAQALRRNKASSELRELEKFRPSVRRKGQGIGIGTIVEIEDEDSGMGRTFFLAPVGAGMALTGPDGDGHITVVTPASPIGRAVLARRVGDVVQVKIKGEVREWAITFVC